MVVPPVKTEGRVRLLPPCSRLGQEKSVPVLPPQCQSRLLRLLQPDLQHGVNITRSARTTTVPRLPWSARSRSTRRSEQGRSHGAGNSWRRKACFLLVTPEKKNLIEEEKKYNHVVDGSQALGPRRVAIYARDNLWVPRKADDGRQEPRHAIFQVGGLRPAVQQVPRTLQRGSQTEPAKGGQSRCAEPVARRGPQQSQPRKWKTRVEPRRSAKKAQNETPRHGEEVHRAATASVHAGANDHRVDCRSARKFLRDVLCTEGVIRLVLHCFFDGI